MENSEGKKVKRENGFVEQALNILYLNNKQYNITNDVQIPVNITEIYLAHNDLKEVPYTILTLKNIRKMDLSFNKIEYFDDTPSFCDQIEWLNLSHNDLKSPPHWVWQESPNNLKYLDLSYNIYITDSFRDGYFEDLLQYENLVTHIKLNNCRLSNYLQILRTFPKVQILDVGTEELNNFFSLNSVPDIPFKGLENCCDLKKLNVSNTDVILINPNIDIFKNLKEINLTQNRLSGLPKEFCYLLNLEICLLSFNNIIYLPDEFNNLKKLIILTLDANRICMLPNMCSFPNLIKLDVYDNKLYDLPDGVENILEIDLALNFFEEPSEEGYLRKKNKLRLHKEGRKDGKKEDIEIPDSPKSWYSFNNDYSSSIPENHDLSIISSDSSEDWDSDDHWIPHYIHHDQLSESPWICYVKNKMAEGKFCPMDAHTVSVEDQVKYEKLCNPYRQQEIEGQFDDFSGDES